MAIKNQSYLLTSLLSLLLSGCDDNLELITEPKNKEIKHVYPAPRGQYKVGVNEFDVKGYSKDSVSPNSDELRKIHFKIHYPADGYHENYSTYFDKLGNQVDYLKSKRPKEARLHPLQHDLNTMWSWSVENANIIKHEGAGWPVLFYSHGLALFENDNTELVEDLASHGFIVVSVNHTYLSGVTTFENGQTANLYLPNDKHDVGTPIGRKYFDEVVSPQISNDVQNIYNWMLWNQWRLNDQVDLSNVGTLGYSLGASAAMNSCKSLFFCKASVNIDGLVLGEAAKKPLNKPLLLLSSEESLAQLDSTFKFNLAETHLITIENSTHDDFYDLNRWIVGLPTAIAPDKIHNIIKGKINNFFQNKLNHTELVFSEEDGVVILSK
ncbi:hypothetical protein KO527_22385 [Pseudoalteromonas sp. C2R02]|uniref:alpha/beta hydrolase n=1 Tax=Pseudoalteromonas sp. C2R02 TaxID=2841565 RepID=UPI001C08BEFD|nr:hypothetical protein [Pseudoalteromonas sp. C2R02]MBU2972090.1 hypothetical protein [Pseudoalteromonas sp. C2R02]